MCNSDTSCKHYEMKRHRRRKSETLRAQYINTKELRSDANIIVIIIIMWHALNYKDINEINCIWIIFRVTIGTWNVAGKHPCNDLEIESWLYTEEPSEIYIIGLVCDVPHRWYHKQYMFQTIIKSWVWYNGKHLCAWGNDAVNEVLTEARLLLVENYFQTPS